MKTLMVIGLTLVVLGLVGCAAGAGARVGGVGVGVGAGAGVATAKTTK